MALFTATPTAKHFVTFRDWGGLASGSHVRVVGTPPASLAKCARETSEPYPLDPGDVFDIDMIQAALDEKMIAETAAAATRPDNFLTSEQLWKKLPWTKDPQKFALASTQHGFPPPVRLTGMGEVTYAWSERKVDEWVAATREKLEQLREFVG